MRTTKNRKSLVLAICFALAGLFWILLNFSNTYEENFKFPLKYSNSPENIVITSELPQFVDLKISASGWNLLSLYLRKPRKNLVIDLSKAENLNRIILQNYKSDFNLQIDSKFEIVEVSSPLIMIDYAVKVDKKIPVKLSFIKDIPDPYDFVGTPNLSPDSIIVSGPQSILDTLSLWKTEKIRIDQKRDYVKSPILLKQSDKVSTSVETVFISIRVSAYERLDLGNLPIEISDCQSQGDLMIFPNNAKVSFLVPSDMKSAIEDSEVTLEVDCTKAEAGKDNFLQVNLKSDLDFIKDVNISPDFVEFKLYK